MKKLSGKVMVVVLSLLGFTLFNCDETTKKEGNSTKAEPQKTEVKAKVATTQSGPVLNITLPKIDASSKPGDVLAAYKSLVQKVDAALPKLQKKEEKVTLFNEPNTPVSIWYDNGKPVKIKYGVKGDTGAFDGDFSYYLKDGKVWYSDQIFAKYLFEGNKLKYWVDENWNVNDIPQNDFKDAEKRILSNINTLLSKVG